MGASARSWTTRGFYHLAGPLFQFETLRAAHLDQKDEVLEIFGAGLFQSRTPWHVSRVMKAWRVQQCVMGQPVVTPVWAREWQLRKITWFWPHCSLAAFSTLTCISSVPENRNCLILIVLAGLYQPLFLKMQQNKHLCAGHMPWPCHIYLDKVAFSAKHYFEL